MINCIRVSESFKLVNTLVVNGEARFGQDTAGILAQAGDLGTALERRAREAERRRGRLEGAGAVLDRAERATMLDLRVF